MRTAPVIVQAFDPASVTPGVVGFVATAVVATIVCLLLFDMNRRVRRVKFREEVRADIAAEQAAAHDAAAQGRGAAATEPSSEREGPSTSSDEGAPPRPPTS